MGEERHVQRASGCSALVTVHWTVTRPEAAAPHGPAKATNAASLGERPAEQEK
jgi:hypothetical protein